MPDTDGNSTEETLNIVVPIVMGAVFVLVLVLTYIFKCEYSFDKAEEKYRLAESRRIVAPDPRFHMATDRREQRSRVVVRSPLRSNHHSQRARDDQTEDRISFVNTGDQQLSPKEFLSQIYWQHNIVSHLHHESETDSSV